MSLPRAALAACCLLAATGADAAAGPPGPPATTGAGVPNPASRAADPFAPAPLGCAMSHCDPRMSDAAAMPAPRKLEREWFDSAAASAEQGLGCVANGKLALCTSGNRDGDYARPYLKAYGPAGDVLWDSGTTLNSWAWTSVPILAENGDSITADDAKVVRFARDGRVVWSTPTPGGRPISPTQTRDGTVVLATAFGPISAFDPETGEHLATLDLTATLDGLPGRFDTTNTPGVNGNRVYVSADFKLTNGARDPNNHARLYAIDVDPTAPPGERLRVAWFFEFGARSGASPLITEDGLIVFDGDRETPQSALSPRFFALRDTGPAPALVWQHELNGLGVASAAADPRGGAWTFAFLKPALQRISLADGSVLQTIDLDAVVGEPGSHTPWSGMTIAEGRRDEPVMLVSARAGSESAFLVAIDLTTATALWKYRLPDPVPANTAMGQFPILRGPGDELTTVFSTRGGVHGIGERPRYKRKLTLAYAQRKRRFQGRLRSVDPRCERARVRVFKRRAGPDRKLGGARTTNGRWRLRRAAKPGRYYATVKPRTLQDGDCRKAKSKRLRIHRR